MSSLFSSLKFKIFRIQNSQITHVSLSSGFYFIFTLMTMSCSDKQIHGKSSLSVRSSWTLPRGVWIAPNSSDVYKTRENIISAIDNVQKMGVNSIFPVVWNKQSFFYESATIRHHLGDGFIKTTVDGEDILTLMLQLAQERNLRVFPSFESGLKVVLRQEGSNKYQELGEWVLAQDNWLLRNRHTKEIIEMCHFDVCFGYLNILNLNVRKWLKSFMTDLIVHYPVEGILLDDHFSLPRSILDCDPNVKSIPNIFEMLDSIASGVVTSVREKIAFLSPKDVCRIYSNVLRENAILSFIEEIKKIASTHGKRLLISPAGLPKWSRESWMQDWKQMIQKEFVDGVIMQSFIGGEDFYNRVYHDSIQPSFHEDMQNDIPIGIVILLGLKEAHYYAHGERIYQQTQTVLASGRQPSYFYHEMVDIPVNTRSIHERLLWMSRIKELLKHR